MTSSFSITQTPTSKNLWLYPNGDAHHSEVSVVGSASHYLNVDDPYDMPDDDTTYNWMMGTSTVTDMYNLDDTTKTGTINYLKIFGRAKSYLYTIAGTGYYRILANHSGTTSRQTCTLTTDYNTFQYLLLSTPSGGAWNWTAINALKIGWDAVSPNITGITAYETLRPNANGTLQQWDTCNYLSVDDTTPDEDATYDAWVHPYTGETSRCNSYKVSNHTVSGTPQALIVNYRAKTGYNVSCYLRSFVSLSGVSVGGTYISPWTYYADHSERYATDPGGGAWSWADIDAVEIGCQLKTDYSGFSEYDFRLTQIYALVEYLTDVYPQIRTTQMYALVNYTPSSGTCFLIKPHTYTYTNNRQVNKINTWAGERKVYDVCRTSKTLTMSGVEYNRPNSVATTNLNCVKIMKDQGDPITISNIGDTLVDTIWLIEDFTYSKNMENMNIWDWTLTCERYENV